MKKFFMDLWRWVTSKLRLIQNGLFSAIVFIGNMIVFIGQWFNRNTSWFFRRTGKVIRNVLDIIVFLPEAAVLTIKHILNGIMHGFLLFGRFVHDYVPRVVFSLLEAIYAFSSRIKHLCSGIASGFVSSVRNKAELKERVTADETKQRKRLKQLLNTFHISVPLFENTASEIGYNFAIYICQGVSFFTTLGGASYYLSGIAEIIPGIVDAGFLTALLIQGMIIKLSKKRGTRKSTSQWLLLSLLTTVSICFSFIGTANITAPPYAKYSKQFDEKVYSSVSNILSMAKDDGYAGKLTAIGSPARLANLMYGKYSDVGLMLSENQPVGDDPWSSLRSRFEEYSGDFSNLGALTQALQGNDEEIIKKINNEYDDLMVLARNMAKAVNFEKPKYNDDGSPVIENGQRKTEIVQFHPLTTPLYPRIQRYYNIQDMEPLTSADVVAGKTDIFQTNEENLKSQYSSSDESSSGEKGNDSNGNDENEQGFLKMVLSLFQEYRKKLGGTETAVEEYNLVLDNFYAVAQQYYQCFMPLFEDDEQKKDNSSSLNVINTAAKNFLNRDNANLIHFKRLFSSEGWGHLIVPLIIAFFFDGLTFLIALAAENRLPGVLRVKSNRDNMDSEAALLEQVFFSMNEEFIKETVSGEKTGVEYMKECEDAVWETISQIKDYLSKFELSPETRQQGCAQKATKKVLEEAKVQPLTTILLQRGYLVYLSPDEYVKFMEETQDVHLSSDNKRKLMTDGGYYFLRNRAQNYLRQSVNGETIFLRIIKQKVK